MPLFGLGTWLSEGKGEARRAVLSAFEAGYRQIDTADMYKNEEDIGNAIKESKLQRESIFVTSKLHPENHGKAAAAAAIDASLKRLGVKAMDLFLIHSPKTGKILETWAALVEAKKAGKIRAIGVSNFGVQHLQGLKAAGVEMPEVNQVELHLWNQQKAIVDYCRKEGIAVTGYCPLARLKRFGKTDAAKVAEELKRTEAQVCIRWSLQKGVITIPKSSNEKRIRENADVFDWTISDDLMQRLDKLEEAFSASTANQATKMPWDPLK